MTEEPITELEKLAREMAEARREVIHEAKKNHYGKELSLSLSRLQQPNRG